MTIEQRTMRGDEREKFLDLVEAAFGFRDMFARYLDVSSLVGPDDTWLAVDGERLVGSVQIFEKTIRIRGHALPWAELAAWRRTPTTHDEVSPPLC